MILLVTYTVLVTYTLHIFFSSHIPACYKVEESRVSHNTALLKQRGIVASLKCPTVAAWKCWGLNPQPSGR